MAQEKFTTEILAQFYQKLLISSEGKTQELPELKQRPSKLCTQRFTLNLLTALQIQEEVMLAGLLIAKTAVESNLKVGKRYLNRLVALSVMLAEKCYVEEQNPVEMYSLVTGIPIKELNQLEVKLMILMDYRLVIKEREFELLQKGELETLFSEQIFN